MIENATGKADRVNFVIYSEAVQSYIALRGFPPDWKPVNGKGDMFARERCLYEEKTVKKIENHKCVVSLGLHRSSAG